MYVFTLKNLKKMPDFKINIRVESPERLSIEQKLDIVLDIGISRIYEHNMKLTQDIIDRATDRGYELLTPHDPKQRGSIVNIQVDNQHEMADTLKNNNFILDARANGIRVAPHFYNNTEDVDKLFEILK